MENLAPIVGSLDFITKQYADSKGVPVASTVLFLGSPSPPSGYLLCNGQAVSRTTYAALFAAISTAYGVGDGSTTFNLPSMKAMVGVGATFLTKYYVIKY